jgi:hypothetical protein
MAVRLTTDLRVGGAVVAANRVITRSIPEEADLVARGVAEAVDLSRLGRDLFGPDRDYVSGLTATNGSGATIVSSGFVTFQGERMFQVVCTGTAASQNHIEINLPAETIPYTADSCTVEFATPTWANVTGITMYIGTAGYAVFASASQGFQAMTDTTQYHNGLNAFTLPNAAWAKSGFTGELTDQVWTAAKLRVGVVNGQTATFLLRSIRVNERRQKGRIAVTFDDGRDDFTQRALPILQRHGIRASLGIIPVLIGTTNYLSEDDLRRVYALGHECVAHGPRTGANLWDAPNDDSRLEDMATTVNYLKARGLLRPNGDKVYVWPQGRYGASVGDVAFLKKAYQAGGFRIGRTASTQQPRYHALSAMSERCETKLTYPIIGHLNAGAANTADDATETTNVTSINTRITEVGAAKVTAMLMFHEVVARGAANVNVQIEGDRLNTILAHLRTQMDAGNVENVLMSELV